MEEPRFLRYGAAARGRRATADRRNSRGRADQRSHPQNAGRTIRLLSSEYKVEMALTVPNGATLQGAGVMLFDDQGLPVKFKQGTTTTITAKPGLKGNLVTLGNQSSLRRLVLEGAGANQVGLDDAGRGGNVVAAASRARGDIISAMIDECKLINHNKSMPTTTSQCPSLKLTGRRGARSSPTHAIPKNPAPDPLPHEDAEVTPTLTRSIVDIPKDGKAVFAMNFASHGKVTINLIKNDIGGPLDVIGGLSRPNAVVGATTTITSHGNRYSPQPESDVEAWQIIGGSSSPFGGNANTDSNSASVQSRDDQIENFWIGIKAIGRRLPGDGTCSHNKARLELLHMKLATKPPEKQQISSTGAPNPLWCPRQAM
jgi:hypothetical protein